MANWSKYSLVFAIFLLLYLATSSAAIQDKRWGFYGHKRINRMATFCLPPSMFGFYKEHLEYLTEHAVDPDKRRYAVDGEAQCHYIDLDHYHTNAHEVFDVIPKKWDDAVTKFTEDTLKAYGIVPWHIMLMKTKLQRAFEEKNVDLILKYSADLGHYIGDAHVPLHTTKNYNGQLTNQRGIHGLWESRLVEINADNYDYFVGKATYISNLNEFIWRVVKESHLAVDSVLSIEKEVSKLISSDLKYTFEQRGNTNLKTYSKPFSELYHLKLNNMVERRLRSSILTVGNIWYTAWVDAGQPELASLQNTPPSAELLQELKKLDYEFIHSKHKGRICD